MKRLSEVLLTSLDRPEILRAGRAQRLMRDWPNIVGETVAAHCVPDRYERGTLWVAASGNAWAQELRFMKDEVLEKLNNHAGERLFESMRVGTRPPRRDWLSKDE